MPNLVVYRRTVAGIEIDRRKFLRLKEKDNITCIRNLVTEKKNVNNENKV
ncbi:12008_t:CDS:2 [Cetraspora pellucida]|uniref:12008_t:CDS:1 n=1 Tax=Cetraspora pellucida TaxID=1433469 RepID=A0ACA9KZ66_9GLOM|nr:12008_t:CDS:2 [Cetraspora pellucida]